MRTLIQASQIDQRLEAMARSIAAEMPPDFLMLVMMKGAMVFGADLMRALWREGARPRIDVMTLSNYAVSQARSGEATLIGEIPGGVKRANILLVDDVADTGASLDGARARLFRAGASTVKVCVLLNKPSRRTVPAPLDFVGFEVEDVTAAGYGMDHNGDLRYLPHVVAVEP